MGKAREETPGTLADRGIDLAVRAGIAAARQLPYAARVRAFGALTERLIPPTRFGTRIDQNLSFIYPQMPAAGRRALARRSANGLGRLLIENYSGRDLCRHMADVTPAGPGVAALAAAVDDGRPILFLTGHFGNYEAARACLIGRGHPIGGLYRPMENPFFNAHYVETMKAIGGPIFAQGRAGTKGLIAHLRGGGLAMLLNDLYVGSGIELPFMGQPAMTSTSAAEIALRVDAEIIPVWGIRQADGLSFDVVLDAPLPQGDVVATTLAYNAAVEARVRAHPEQWFWMHRRWKKKWSGGKGAAEATHPAQLPGRVSKV